MARAWLACVLAVSLLGGPLSTVFAAANPAGCGTDAVLAPHELPAVAVAVSGTAPASEGAAMRRLPLPAATLATAVGRTHLAPVQVAFAAVRHRSYYPRRRCTGPKPRGCDGDVPH